MFSVLALTGCLSNKFKPTNTSHKVEVVAMSLNSNPLHGKLILLRVTKLGIVVMTYTTNKEYVVYGSSGQQLRGECGDIAYTVVSSSMAAQTVVISYPKASYGEYIY
jgi:hypothetical protein